MAVLHINSGELPGIGSVADPRDVFVQMFQRFRECYNIESIGIQAPPGCNDMGNGDCGSLGIDELAAGLGVRPMEDSGIDAGVFIEGKSGKHYPIFEIARRFLEAINNMFVGYATRPEMEEEDAEPEEEIQATDAQEVPEDQSRHTQGPE